MQDLASIKFLRQAMRISISNKKAAQLGVP